MLLPSALPCEAQPVTPKTSRPKLVTFAAYRPEKAEPSALQASCRALQIILGGSLNVPSQPLHQRPGSLRSPLRPVTRNQRPLQSSPLKPYPPRGTNKRRRDEFERAEEDVKTESEKENIPHGCCTPKRQRRAPLSMPLGLSAEDFEALERPRDEDIELDMPDCQSPDGVEHDWTAADDRMLVETVLEKLNLTKREWNECSHILGRSKGDLGTRWKVLVGEGNVGIRRGRRRMERTDLEIRSW